MSAHLVTTSAAQLSWSAVGGAGSYRLRSAAGVVVWSGAATVTRRTGLRPGIRYAWRVQAVAGGARSPWSTQVTVTPPPLVPPGLTATVTATGVTLRWRAAAGAASYLAAPVDSRGAPAGRLHPTRATSLPLTGLAAGSTGAWAVVAVAADRTRSAWSTPITFTAPTAAPAGVTVLVTTAPTAGAPSATVDLSWRPAAGAVAYRAYDYRGRPVYSGTDNTVSVAGLAAGARYEFTVASVNRAGLVSHRSPPASTVTPRLPDPTPTRETLTWGGLTRSFYVAVPTGASSPTVAGARPVIVLLHGDDDTAPRFLATTRLLGPALAAGEVVVAPESIGGLWNDGRLDPGASGGTPGRDDVGFVLAAVDSLVQQGIVDPHRVTVAGYSNGAGLAMRIAAADPSGVAELVSFSGALLADGRAVLPRDPVPTVLVHGDADLTQPWDGRDEISPRLPAQMSQPDTRRVWQAADAADGAGVTTSITAPPWAPTLATTTVQRWAGASPVTFYRISAGAHLWPYEPCAVGSNAGCSADVRTDAQAEALDGTALLVSIADVAHR